MQQGGCHDSTDYVFSRKGSAMLTFFACSDKIIGWLDCQWQPGSPLWVLAGLVGLMVAGAIVAVAVLLHVRRRSSSAQE